MSTSLKQTFYFFLLLVIANICAGTFNMTHNYKGNLKDVIEMTPGLIWCAFIFWISCQWKPKTNLRLYFLPGLRIAFWSLIVFIGIWTDKRMNSEDFLYANNELFFWWVSLKMVTPKLRDYNQFAELFLIDIFSIAIGQLLMIFAAVFIDKKIGLRKQA
jgi:hypothetical protein